MASILGDFTPISAILGFGETIINKLFPDPAQAAEAKYKLIQLQQQGELQESQQVFQEIMAQANINAIEAANQNVFVSGWRPFIGWVCGSGFAIEFVAGPILEWLSGAVGHPVKFPVLDNGALTGLVTAMLGLGTMRTVEKVQAVVQDRKAQTAGTTTVTANLSS